jgi:hypothetical protein
MLFLVEVVPHCNPPENADASFEALHLWATSYMIDG